MNRFHHNSYIKARIVLLLLLPLSLSSVVFPNSIEYIREDIPDVSIPPYEGERYEDTVPDTIDIAESCRLSVNALTGALNPHADYELYFSVDFGADPPRMTHDRNDWCQVKFQESLPLMRIASGSKLNTQVDEVWKDAILKSLGPDGLSYMPMIGRPWMTEGWQSAVKVWRKDGTTAPLTDPSVTQFAAPWNTMRMVSVMTIHYLRDNNPIWREACERIIDRLLEASVKRGEAAYFPNDFLEPFARLPRDIPLPTGGAAVDWNGRIMHGCAHFYRATGYENARVLGDKFANYVIDYSEYFGPDGEWLIDQLDPEQYPGRENNVHCGIHSHTLHYLIDYANATDNAELRGFVHKSFEWALNRNAELGGQSKTANKIGFFLEYFNDYYPHAEHCGVADMTSVALKLTESGADDYWDEVDGWIRNHFISNQITDPEPLLRGKTATGEPEEPGMDHTTYQVVERNIGAFMGWPSANDGNSKIMHCCTGNGTRAMYYIWKSILDYQDGELKVNLLMNRASKWADLYSYIPYEGRVELKVKQPLQKVTFRVPQWISTSDPALKCEVEGKEQALAWRGRYVSTGTLEPGSRVVLTFPIEETVLEKRVYREPHHTFLGAIEYDKIVFRGNTVVDIKPEGKSYPYYQRDHYRTGKPRMKKVERFISNEDIYW